VLEVDPLEVDVELAIVPFLDPLLARGFRVRDVLAEPLGCLAVVATVLTLEVD
jgi:hypothetical protein